MLGNVRALLSDGNAFAPDANQMLVIILLPPAWGFPPGNCRISFTTSPRPTCRRHGSTAARGPAIYRRLTRLMGGSVGFETAQATGGLSFAGISFLSFHSAVSPPLRLHPADLLALCGSHGP